MSDPLKYGKINIIASKIKEGIVNPAFREAEKTINNANEDAAKIIDKAKKEAREIKDKTSKECVNLVDIAKRDITSFIETFLMKINSGVLDHFMNESLMAMSKDATSIPEEASLITEAFCSAIKDDFDSMSSCKISSKGTELSEIIAEKIKESIGVSEITINIEDDFSIEIESGSMSIKIDSNKVAKMISEKINNSVKKKLFNSYNLDSFLK